MYGRADGMPSFQLTVAVRARYQNLLLYKSLLSSSSNQPASQGFIKDFSSTFLCTIAQTNISTPRAQSIFPT
jgi:hypothetical protein